jgi:hypothetical protein
VETQTTINTQGQEPGQQQQQPPAPAPQPRPSTGARRAGYLAVIMVSAAVLCVVDWYPGWHTAAFLTLAAGVVMGLVNLLLVALILVNMVYLAFDPPWIRLAGDLACAIIGLVTAIRIWQVFPFAVSQPWVSGIRVLLVMAIAGTFAAIVVELAKLIRIIARR